ncbi:MAG: hypothetical protein ACOYCD_04115 [Kiritimatiellia bacterium]|jgi:hypothetical protein
MINPGSQRDTAGLTHAKPIPPEYDRKTDVQHKHLTPATATHITVCATEKKHIINFAMLKIFPKPCTTDFLG